MYPNPSRRFRTSSSLTAGVASRGGGVETADALGLGRFENHFFNNRDKARTIVEVLLCL